MKKILRVLLGLLLLKTPLAATAQQSGEFTYSSDGSVITIIHYTGPGGEVIIPGTIADLPVTTIAGGVFHYAGTMTSLAFPNSVTNISLRGSGFQNCSNLLAFIVDPANPSYASVDGVLFNRSQTTLLRHPGAKAGNYLIPGSVTNVEDSAFQNCRDVVEVIIPEGVTRIGTFAFSSCANLTNAAIPSSVTSLGSHAFKRCSSLGSVTIPGSIQYVQDGTFGECSSLTNLAIANGVISCWPGAFADCTSLTRVTLPDSLLSIGSFAFLRCASLTSANLPQGLRTLGEFAFSGCASLTNATIPGTVLTIGPNAFLHCSNLTSVTIANGVRTIGNYAFDSCFNLPALSIPGSVTNIGDWAFQNCTNLGFVSLNEGLRTIGYAAFTDCRSLANITIPASVTKMAPLAFSDCPNLTGIFFKGNQSPNFSPGFAVGSTPTLYYLPGASGWGTTFGGRPVLLWNPLMHSSDPSFGVGPAGFGFTITGTTNIPIVVEAATNLTEANWVALQSLNLTNGSFYFSDPDWASFPTRQYRIRSP